MPELSLLYVGACLRHASLLYNTWLANGLTPLAFDALLHGRQDIERIHEKERLDFLSVRAGLSRSVISEVLAQAHGPWLLHLGPRERIEVLRRLANMYSKLHYRRKETYILRELLASLMDLLVQGREESKGASELSLAATDDSGPNRTAGSGNVGIRERYDAIGNSSILRLVKYICEVHGVSLDSVKFKPLDGSNGPVQPRDSQTNFQPFAARRANIGYAWPELQIGLIRESLAVAEALPGKSVSCNR